MSMIQIGILGKPSRKRFQIVSKLELQTRYLIRVFSSVADMKQYLRAGLLNGLILVEDEFKDEHVELMDELAFSHEDLSILCVVAQISQSQREEIQRYNIKRCTVLDYNHELKDLTGVIERMTRGDQVVLRSHYRYTVSKRAFLVMDKGPSQTVKIVDLSQGGLQAKVPQIKVIAGQRIQMRVPLGDGRGFHLIYGRVAWVSRKGFIGMQFDQVLSRAVPAKTYGWAS